MSASEDHPAFWRHLLDHLVRDLESRLVQAEEARVLRGDVPQERRDLVAAIVDRAQRVLEWARQAAEDPRFVGTGDIDHGIHLGQHSIVTRRLEHPYRIGYHLSVDGRQPNTIALMFAWQRRHEAHPRLAQAVSTELLRIDAD